MRSRPFITGKIICTALAAAFFAVSATFADAAKSIAVLTPQKTPLIERFVELVAAEFGLEHKVLDGSMAATAFAATGIDSPFNLSSEEAQRAASVIGCDHFIVVRAETFRRTAYERPEYYESIAVVFAVNGRDGRLAKWLLRTFEGGTPAASEALLFASAAETGNSVIAALAELRPKLPSEIPHFPEPPAEDSPAAKNFRAPVPYKRIRAEYTRQASMYNIEATVDLMVDIDADGNILRTDIVRWAGFGLEESVIETVRKMNWRPAERNGKTLPMRVLLRYNFKNIPDPDQ